MIKRIAFLALFFLLNYSYSQTISGKVLFKDNGVDFPIEGANVFWLNTNQGTITKAAGEFNIQKIRDVNSALLAAPSTPQTWQRFPLPPASIPNGDKTGGS